MPIDWVTKYTFCPRAGVIIKVSPVPREVVRVLSSHHSVPIPPVMISVSVSPAAKQIDVSFPANGAAGVVVAKAYAGCKKSFQAVLVIKLRVGLTLTVLVTGLMSSHLGAFCQCAIV